jgi:hypothetical protein
MAAKISAYYIEPSEITVKLASRIKVPRARERRVFNPVPFHSPVATPITVEKRMVDAMTIAKEI